METNTDDICMWPSWLQHVTYVCVLMWYMWYHMLRIWVMRCAEVCGEQGHMIHVSCAVTKRIRKLYFNRRVSEPMWAQFLSFTFYIFRDLTLPFFTLQCLSLLHIALAYLVLPYIALSYLTLLYLTLPCPDLPYFTLHFSLHLPYLTLPNLIMSWHTLHCIPSY